MSDLEGGPTALAAKLVVTVVRLLLSAVQVLRRLCLLAGELPPFINSFFLCNNWFGAEKEFEAQMGPVERHDLAKRVSDSDVDGG